jgi:hypothetical protein
MFKIFSAPTELFTRLKEKPQWVLALVIVIVVNMGVAALSTRYVDWSKQRDLATERMQERGMSEEQIEEALEQMEKFTGNPVMRYGAPLVGALITQLIGFFFLALVYNLALPLLGTTGSYMKVVSVTAHASLVAIPGAIVRAILMLIRRSAEVSTSLALAFPNVESKFLGVVLARVDIFTIWQLVLVGLGLKVVFDTKGSKSYWLAIAVWALVTIIFGLIANFTGGGQ